MAIRSSTSQAQADWALDARGQAVLAAIIKEHLRTGEPVGSRTISERFAGGVGWSSATIRNVMAELEELGLVEQPHTSAGRVPTDKGYRFYVDHLIGDTRLSRADLSAIDRTLGVSADGAQPSRLMEKVSHALSELSENVGIVVSPPVSDSRLEHVEFLQLSDGRILVVLVFAPNVVQNKIIRLDERLTQEELESAARYLNAEFSGKGLQAIRSEVLALMQEEKALYDRLLRNAVMLFERSVEGDDAETGDVYIDGASNILAKPDFSDAERLRELFRTFEAKSRLVKILNECIAREPVFGDVHVVIGREHSAPQLQSCALITAPYRLGEGFVAGTVGVVGPMRLEYARTIAAVNYVARLVERMLREEVRI
ncbi:MAG TPA: heat-inducible transcriptional repressor HrcA [Pyrinomonadaceae bacterium]|jgi:heat-inducible transcriptional repressor|nr:heat-inducible transcriptional repressor HrcA [Pyrinomonadaceae bacterium]